MGLFKLGLSIAIIPPTLLVSFILWENFIHYWHKPKRRNALESWLNETKSNQHLDNATSGEELESMLGKELSDSFYYFNLRMMRSLIVAGRYLNPFPEWQDRNILSVFEHLKWRLTRSNKRVKRMKDLVPVTEPNFKLLYNFHTISNESEMTATWIGQSTLFVQMQGLNILTDPHFRYTFFSNYLIFESEKYRKLVDRSQKAPQGAMPTGTVASCRYCFGLS